MKDYLSAENSRNHENHRLYEALMRRAMGACDVLVVHHITFHIDGQEPNEVPSADTLMFDHEIMAKVFPGHYKDICMSLAAEPVESRDKLLQRFLELFPAMEKTGT